MLDKLNIFDADTNWPLLIGMMALIILITAGLTFYLNLKGEEGFKINPQVQLVEDKEYQITYWDYPLFIGQEGDYEEFLQEAIGEFNDMYPNIKVNYELLSFINGEDKLQEKLEEGKPPDIYNDIFSKKLISKELQIPVDIFFAAESTKERDIFQEYNQLGIKALSYDEKIWGMPNWLAPQVWVGNRSLLSETNLDLTRIQEEGWTWDTFYQGAKQIKDLNRKSCIIFNPYNSKLFYQLLRMNGTQSLISKEGELLLTSQQLETTFDFLDDLRSHELFYDQPEEMNKKLLPYFWQNRAGIIAPVNIWLLNNLYQRDQKESDVELTLMPIPTNDPEEKRVPLKVSSLLLFRQEEYKGDDHTKAVYKFAKFMNQQKQLFVAKKLNVVPVYLSLAELWKEETDLSSKIKEEILTYINRGSYQELSGFQNMKYEAQIKQVIDQQYEAFWLEGEPITKVTDEIMTKAQEILNLNQNPEKED
ncbi:MULTISPECIES: ABC transporter substrate-binding protein [unclassified Candidatus Frackibacter]|uniref:ABC transporter substrate-binding protein n=1 Tax=unclassified Candidatus Frackibacter TaxID=2648818 RepID=UPI000883DB3C|nr:MULTISPECIES: extracellular solute-binding protein [unclassified Candidatus Frackibacter]SDC26048.1 carbohydrate ABC transporter substrate-binding protein, CUT1 family [Candidatus Frackibacter sp. WG11]SEM53046.1 carbohydrate ABC transporter substrate-binding protein, CUT1 family [Candidatus Frackibacter sp. WG12]SFL55437.1 carbohydrate ABC transporter substrate-binding protein, CUT1 family [Candidatus Frackibacter sp. WG13]